MTMEVNMGVGSKLQNLVALPLAVSMSLKSKSRGS